MAKCRNAESHDTDYLEKNNVKDLVNKGLTQVAIFQPQDPFQFLACHYQWEINKNNPLKYASAILDCGPYPRDTVEFGIQQAFLMINQCKVNQDDLQSSTGSMYMDLIQLLCSELQRQKHAEEELLLLENIYSPPGSVVSFREFRAGVHCCLAYKAYLKSIESLYSAFHDETTNYKNVSRLLTAHLLDYIFKQISVRTDREVKLLLTGSNKLSSAVQDTPEKGFVSSEEFVKIATELFWKNVNVESIFQ